MVACCCEQNFIFYAITGPGPLACATITTTRKFFTILLSVLLHPDNSLAPVQWASVGLVFTGLGGEIYDKWSKGQSPKYAKVPGVDHEEADRAASPRSPDSVAVSISPSPPATDTGNDSDVSQGRSAVELVGRKPQSARTV